MTITGKTRWVILRDLLIFHFKLALDGVKAIVLAPLSIAAVVIDLLFPGKHPGRMLYAVLRLGERFDRWLSLYSAAVKADALSDGLFGASRAGSPTILGQLEEVVIGYREPLVES